MKDILSNLCCFSFKKSSASFTDVMQAKNVKELMVMTIPVASHLEEDQELKSCALLRLKELTANQGTSQKINTLFDAAKSAVGDKEKLAMDWLHTCIIHTVIGSSSMVTQGTYGAMGSSAKAPTTCKPRGMKPSSKPTFPGIVVSPYEEEDMEQAVKQTLTITQQRQNGTAVSEGESDISAAAASSKKKKKRKPRRGGNHKKATTTAAANGEKDNTLNQGGLTAPQSWYSGYDSATTDGSVTDGGESDVSRNSTAESRRKLGLKNKQGSLAPGAGYDAIVEKMTGSTEDVLFVKPFFFPDYTGKSFDAFISVIYAARETLYVCIYSFTDDHVAYALGKAKQRNVDVRIISDDQTIQNEHADVKRLHKDFGIPYRTDNNRDDYMHNKFAIIDGKILITGSYNWSKHARYDNQENIIITNVPNCVQAFEQEFERLWNQFSDSALPEKKKNILKNGNRNNKSLNKNITVVA